PSVTYDMRIVLLKAGFETLLAVGDKLEHQRRALTALLPQHGPERRLRPDTYLDGRPNPQVMSALEWWFTRFTYLRNSIVHGEPVTPRARRHGRNSHLWLAEHYLRHAVRETVVRAGFPDLRFDPGYERNMMRLRRRMLAELPGRVMRPG